MLVEASPCPPAHGLTGHCPALGCCTEAACRREEDAAGSAEAPGLVLHWNTLKATRGPTAEVPVMLPGGLPHWDTPSAAREITLYTIATIYLWYVLIYNIHCVR